MPMLPPKFFQLLLQRPDLTTRKSWPWTSISSRPWSAHPRLGGGSKPCYRCIGEELENV